MSLRGATEREQIQKEAKLFLNKIHAVGDHHLRIILGKDELRNQINPSASSSMSKASIESNRSSMIIQSDEEMEEVPVVLPGLEQTL